MNLVQVIESKYGQITNEELAFAIVEISNENDSKKRSITSLMEYVDLVTTYIDFFRRCKHEQIF